MLIFVQDPNVWSTVAVGMWKALCCVGAQTQTRTPTTAAPRRGDDRNSEKHKWKQKYGFWRGHRPADYGVTVQNQRYGTAALVCLLTTSILNFLSDRKNVLD